MDKVSGANSQASPIWDRQKSSRGHYSSVDGALQAHRQRNAERQNRVEERLNMVRSMQNQFFPTPQAMETTLNSDNLGNQGIQNQAMIQNQIPQIQNEIETLEVAQFNPMEMDEIYNEASLGSISDNAMGIVQKEIANPEEGPIDDMPKGSYIDYTV